MDIEEEEEEESVEKMEQTRLRELRKMFASSLKNCFEPCSIDVRFISRLKQTFLQWSFLDF